MVKEIAKLNFEGNLKTSINRIRAGSAGTGFRCLAVDRLVRFSPARWTASPGTNAAHGVALVAQSGADEFLVTGVDASVSFHIPGRLPGMRMQILSAEEGSYDHGVWKAKPAVERG